ncbi:LamG-like jellyroll fold domain-containing protein [Microbacterium testaceum]|uniref:LamG-like jellyroll fold domain-containing protein n=1 Tax=Microbacterium testaceum TaxID=2033 RepID=UPI003812FAD2
MKLLPVAAARRRGLTMAVIMAVAVLGVPLSVDAARADDAPTAPSKPNLTVSGSTVSVAYGYSGDSSGLSWRASLIPGDGHTAIVQNDDDRNTVFDNVPNGTYTAVAYAVRGSVASSPSPTSDAVTVSGSAVGWPDAPERVTTTTSGDTATVVWQNPSNTGGSAITAARVSITRDGSQVASRDVSGTSATVGGLADGTYVASVQLKNSYVWSNASTTTFTIGAVTVPDPVIDYSFNSLTAGASTVANSGSGGAAYDGVVRNSSALAVGSRDGSPTVSFPGGARGTNSSTMPYIEIPNGIYKNATAITIATWMDWDGTFSDSSPWAFILGGDRLGRNNYGVFMTPNENGKFTTSAVDGNEFKANSVAALPSKTWNHVAITIDGTSLVVYVNGVETDRRNAPLDFSKLYNPNSTYGGLIGRTDWTNGNAAYFAGQFDDFEVFNQALSGAQVAKLAGPSMPTATGYSPNTVQAVSTSVSVQPTLPVFTATFSDGIVRPTPVVWDTIDPAKLYTPGTFRLAGRLPAFGDAAVAVDITVTAPTPMQIDLGASTGPFHGGASGTLYGVYGEDLPSKNLVEGVNLTSIATKTQDGRQHPGADAYEALKNMVDSTGGGTVYIYATDTYYGSGYPITTFDTSINQASQDVVGGAWSGQLAQYKLELKRQIDAAQQLDPSYRSRIVWIPFNEPELNWTGWNNAEYYATWDEIFRYIRSLDPDAKIAGPNNTGLHDVRDFFAHTIAAGTVPDVYTWHELSSPGSIRNAVNSYRNDEAAAFKGTAYEGKQLPVNINEYAHRYHTSVPGQMIQWMAAIEDSKVEGDVAYWNVDGNLNDQAVETNRGNGSWWLYYAYGQMSGNTVRVTPPSTDSYTLQGISTLDRDKKQSRTIVGGATGYQNLAFRNIDKSVFGDSVDVVVQEIPWTGQLGDSPQPKTVAEYTAPVNADGSLDVTFSGLATAPLPAMNEGSAYQIVIAPGARAATTATGKTDSWSGRYEAEAASLSGGAYVQGPNGGPGNVAAFYTSGQYDVGGFATGSNAKAVFSVDVPQDGAYDLQLVGQTTFTDPAASQGATNVFVTVDGQASSEQQMLLPVTYKDFVWDHSDTRVQLTKGTHTLTVSTQGATASTVGNGRIDRIDLTLPNPAASNVYEAELAKLSNASSVDYSSQATSGAGAVSLDAGETASFFVYSAQAGQSDVLFDARGDGAASITLNRQQIPGSLTGTTTRSFTLEAGINKITVTGATGGLVLDRIVVTPRTDGSLVETRYQAEDAKIGDGAPNTKVAEYSRAEGGKAVTGIGGTYAGDTSGGTDKNTLTFTVDAAEDGVQALTIRYSNDVASAASHYNPDTLALHAELSVNGGDEKSIWFANTLNKNQFATTTAYVDLKKGQNTLTFSSRELPNFGQTDEYVSQVYPPTGSLLFRSAWAPQIDWIELAALTTAATAPVSDPVVSLNSSDVVAGNTVDVRAAGFPANADATVTLHSTPVQIATARTRADGTLALTVTIPADTDPGAHEIVVTSGSATASAALTVRAAGSGDPGTGGGSNAGAGGGTPTSASIGTASSTSNTTTAKRNGSLAVTGQSISIGGAVVLMMVLLAGGALLLSRKRGTNAQRKG